MDERTDEALCALAAAGDGEAFETLFKRNQRQLRTGAKKAWQRISDSACSMDLDDLYLAAEIALWEAVQKYQPDKGTKFMTFAWEVIQSRLVDELRRISETREEMPLDEETGEDSKQADIRHYHQSPEVVFFRKMQRQVVRDAIQKLPPRERSYLQHRFGFLGENPITTAEACRVFALSETAAKQMEAQALSVVRQEYEARFKAKIELLLAAEQDLREEGLYVPFVPSSVRGTLPFMLGRSQHSADPVPRMQTNRKCITI